MNRIHLAALCLLAFPPVILAEEKSAYHLFRPVPDSLMREMITDRPDTTESPYTVDAGHWQLEMSFFDYSIDRTKGIRTEAWGFGLVNLKAGLWNHADLQLIFDTHTSQKSTGPDIAERASGFSDVMLRFKQNIWRDDGGTTALALMPYVKIPTGKGTSNGEWEGGLIIPLSITLSERVSLGLMVEADLVHDSDTGVHRWEWLQSATLGIGLTEKMGMYVELVCIAGQKSDFRALFDAGLTFNVTDNLIFDAGVRLGLNGAAEDLGVFTGVSIRF
jgi:hypothetical protein